MGCKTDRYMETKRQYNVGWEVEYENPEQYIESKIVMLTNEMKIQLSEDEVLHLKTLKTKGDIDRATVSIIDRHWG